MGCWFGKVDLKVFVPDEHYIRGHELIERWNPATEDRAKAFIVARVSESRLEDLHPITGITQASDPEDEHLPSIAEALFPLSQVQQIEAFDLGIEADKSIGVTPKYTAEWQSNNARKALEARHNKPGGSREKRAQIREIWASGKYSSRNICAEEECAALGISYSTARRALIGTADPSGKS